MIEKGQKQYAVTITLSVPGKISRADTDSIVAAFGGAVQDAYVHVVNRPLIAEGKTRGQLLAWYAALPSDEQNAVKAEVERFLDRQDSFSASEYVESHENYFEDIRMVGGDRQFVVGDETYDNAREALLAAGFTYHEDEDIYSLGHDDYEHYTELDVVQKAVDRGLMELEDTEAFPPMWNTVWRLRYMPSAYSPQELADFTGATIYEDDNDHYIIGVNGGGYDFYEAHWIPLAYAYGKLSN